MIRRLLAIVFAMAACDQSPQAASPAPPPAPMPMKYWMVFFDTNSATLNDKAASTVAEAAGIAKAMANSTVTVTGFTDTDGSPAYNMALSLRRAQAVKAALVASGVSVGAITISGKGEEGLLVATPDQTKMESNRRVQIVVQ
jgi:outer membrane protein OmpA-like peptidoglycan-associated protein